GHGDVVNRGDVEPELLGEGAGAEALGGAHDGLQQGDAFVEGENGGHDGWGSCLFKINNFPIMAEFPGGVNPKFGVSPSVSVCRGVAGWFLCSSNANADARVGRVWRTAGVRRASRRRSRRRSRWRPCS